MEMLPFLLIALAGTVLLGAVAFAFAGPSPATAQTRRVAARVSLSRRDRNELRALSAYQNLKKVVLPECTRLQTELFERAVKDHDQLLDFPNMFSKAIDLHSLFGRCLHRNDPDPLKVGLLGISPNSNSAFKTPVKGNRSHSPAEKARTLIPRSSAIN